MKIPTFRPQTVLFATLLGVVGAIFNHFDFRLFGALPAFRFGGLVVLLAFSLLGPAAGILTGLLCWVESLARLDALGFLSLLFLFEGWAGATARRRFGSVLLGVSVFWLTVGGALDIGLYRLLFESERSALLSRWLDHGLNGLWNGAAAEAILLLIAWQARRGQKEGQQGVSLGHFLQQRLLWLSGTPVIVITTLYVGSTSAHRDGMALIVLALMLFIAVAAFAVNTWSRSLTTPLVALDRAASGLSQLTKSRTQPSYNLPDSAVAEVRSTCQHFEDLLQSLVEKEAHTEESMRLAVEIAQIATVEWDPASDRIAFGGRANELYGSGPPASFNDLLARTHEEDRERVRQAIETMIEHKSSTPLGFRLLPPDRDENGEVRWIAGNARVLLNDRGRVARVFCVLTDTTRSKKTEQVLRSSEERFRRMVERGWDSIVLLDAKGRLQYFSESTDLLGFPSRSRIGRYAAEDLHLDDQKTAKRVFEQVLSVPGATRHLEVRALGADGEWHWVEAVLTNFLDDPSIGAVVANARDITERRQAEEALVERYWVLFNSVPIGIGIVGASGRPVSFNEASLELSGYTRDEMTALESFDDLYANADEREAVYAELARKQSVSQHEVELVRKDGSTFMGAVSLRPVMLEGDEMLLVAFEDVTARKELEEQLFSSQKLEAVGRLAGGMAHDFNNLMTVILGHTELGKAELSEADPVRSHLERIEWAGERAARLTRQLLAFARRQVMQPKILDLNEVVEELYSMLGRLIEEDVVLRTSTEPHLWLCSIDPGQLEQVLVNLVVNSRDATPSGGTITVSTANVSYKGGDSHYPAMPAADYVCLSVRDTGVGMTAGTKAQIFEPFFTTKDPGKGTGLGLATCYGIIKQAGGYIWAKSAPERGTAIEVFLPRATEEAESKSQPSAKIGPEGGSETLLLVEDERPVNELAAQALRDLGYRVHAVETAERALHVAKGLGHIDLLITDMLLPKLSGPELADRLTAERPDLKVLFISGYARGFTERGGGLFTDDRVFLAKPFTPSELGREVRLVLDRSGEDSPASDYADGVRTFGAR